VNDALATVARFRGLAEAYERYRPDYPPGAIAAVLAGVATPADVADVGAGTGISTRALARAGARAVAIEPSSEMRAIARARGCDARDGSATATGLIDASVDAVSAFQAFHWFATPDALAEFARILRRPGRLAIVWNERALDDPFTAAFRALAQQHGEAAMMAGIDFDEARLEPLLRAAGFVQFRLQTFANAQRVDRESLLGRMRSTSYAPRAGDALDRLIADFAALHARFASPGGTVEIRYKTEVFLADLRTA